MPAKQKHEIEVKLRIANRKTMLRLLKRLNAKSHGRVYEMNVLYDTKEAALARRGQMIRIRVERPARGRAAQRQPALGPLDGKALLTYKGPPAPSAGRRYRGYKVREEHEVRLADGQGGEQILGWLGFEPWFRYEKYRTTYHLPGLTKLAVELDETPIGDFFEIEGSPDQIDWAAAQLGFGPADYISRSYGALHMERERIRPKGIRFKKGTISGPKDRRSRSPQIEPTPGLRLPDMLFRWKSARKR